MIREQHIIPQISCVRSFSSPEQNHACVRLWGEIMTDIRGRENGRCRAI